jgi:hypothetical protein
MEPLGVTENMPLQKKKVKIANFHDLLQILIHFITCLLVIGISSSVAKTNLSW